VTGWVPLVERWLAEEVDGFDPTERWYVGRPVLVTRNDRGSGSTTATSASSSRRATGVQVVFRGATGSAASPEPARGPRDRPRDDDPQEPGLSQFDHVVVVLPDETSPILTRELLYTAVTRAERGVTVVVRHRGEPVRDG
jgi:exodeoxyribonuclease V alpha subunit